MDFNISKVEECKKGKFKGMYYAISIYKFMEIFKKYDKNHIEMIENVVPYSLNFRVVRKGYKTYNINFCKFYICSTITIKDLLKVKLVAGSIIMLHHTQLTFIDPDNILEQIDEEQEEGVVK